ncbi:hypothetical protein NPIL_232831 [Nephila pilipes]|uniref:Uncharacterized protein n=1 Tax=Nephila pilipes TaxID=299642 RepID=A0A8X6PZV3_NEPPI|nr:hypothetical protein NPIL_232831 [Nephila pilipes]
MCYSLYFSLNCMTLTDAHEDLTPKIEAQWLWMIDQSAIIRMDEDYLFFLRMSSCYESIVSNHIRQRNSRGLLQAPVIRVHLQVVRIRDNG